MKAKQLVKWCIVLSIICLSVIIISSALDWLTKYALYIQQRDVLYSLIQNGDETQIESMKKTVSYLQGTATRRVNEIKETSVYFALVIAVFVWVYKKIRSDSQ